METRKTIKSEQSRDTGSIIHITQNKDKQIKTNNKEKEKNTHPYAQHGKLKRLATRKTPKLLSNDSIYNFSNLSYSEVAMRTHFEIYVHVPCYPDILYCLCGVCPCSLVSEYVFIRGPFYNYNRKRSLT